MGLLRSQGLVKVHRNGPVGDEVFQKVLQADDFGPGLSGGGVGDGDVYWLHKQLISS